MINNHSLFLLLQNEVLHAEAVECKALGRDYEITRLRCQPHPAHSAIPALWSNVQFTYRCLDVNTDYTQDTRLQPDAA